MHYVVHAAVPLVAYPLPPALIRSFPDIGSRCLVLTYGPSQPDLALRCDSSWPQNGITADYAFNNIIVVPQRCVRFGPRRCG